MQVPENIHTSHLVKSRHIVPGGTISASSGKLSAISQRKQGAPTAAQSAASAARRPRTGVQFGPPTYLEHSGNEYSTDEEGDDEDGEYDEEEEEEEGEEEEIQMDDRQGGGAYDEGQGGSSEEEIEEDGVRPAALDGSAQDRDRYAQQRQAQQQGQIAQGPTAAFNRNEPDDGMEWDGEATRAAQAARSQQQQQQQQHSSGAAAAAAAASAAAAVAAVQQSGLKAQQGGMQDRTSPLMQVQPLQGRASQDASRRSQDHARGASQDASYRSSSSGSGFLPSQVVATRDSVASSSDAGISGSRSSADLSKEDKRRSANRKSADESTDEKSTKKRSGVFSGLFSRNKDKKERKSGSFTGGSIDSDLASRASEDSVRAGSTPTGLGRTVQERDRLSQQAYQRKFLAGGQGQFLDASAGVNRRPGSLIGIPGSAPTLNVMRIFADDDIESDATFKTVLLNPSTTSKDLVKQAMQRFRITGGQAQEDYVLTVRLAEGDERILHPLEHPLQVFDALTEALPEQTIPSVKRSSIGSISSISSNLSLHPAIARLGNDFSDDHAVKFYLCRRQTLAAASQARSQVAAATATPAGAANWQSADILSLGSLSRDSSLSGGQSADPTARFVLRLLVFPSDLPESLAFDPQTNALIPKEILLARSPSGQTPSESISQQYREKILPFPRNATVAEVVETALDRFGISEGVVEGGDDVEEKMQYRRSKQRIRYSLSVDIDRKEKHLPPNSRVIDAYPRQPILKSGTKEGKRRSVDTATLLSMMNDIRPDDPVFILRQVVTMPKSRTARSLSPTQEALVNKQEQRRQAELETISSQPSVSAVQEASVQPSAAQNQAAMTRQEVIAAQRAAAKAAVLGAQRNDMQGLDVVLTNQARLRSIKSNQGTIRYSYIPVDGVETDISSIVEEVLADEGTEFAAVEDNSRRPSLAVPGRSRSRAHSDVTIEDYHSATDSPPRMSPVSMREGYASSIDSRPPIPGGYVSFTSDRSATPTNQTPTIPARGNDDLLESFVKNPRNDEQRLGQRIDQLLTRMSVTGASPALGGAAPSNGLSATRGGLDVDKDRSIRSFAGSFSSAVSDISTATAHGETRAAPAISSYESDVKPTAPLRVPTLGVEHVYALMDAAHPPNKAFDQPKDAAGPLERAARVGRALCAAHASDPGQETSGEVRRHEPGIEDFR